MTFLGSTLGARLRFLGEDSLVYGLGGALNKAITLITFPLVARQLSVGDFGVVDFLNTVSVLLVAFLVFGQDSAVARYFYEQDDAATRRQLASQSLVLQMGVLLLALPALWCLGLALRERLSLGSSHETVVALVILQLPFFVLQNFAQGLLKWTFRRRQFLVISVGSTVATLVGLLAVMALTDLSVAGLFTVYLGVRAVFAMLGLWYVREWIAMPDGFAQLRRLVPFALPFGIICVNAAALPFLERNVVAAVAGSQGLGLYAAGAKVGMLICLLTEAFETAWGPFALALHRQADAARTYRVVLEAMTIALCGAALMLASLGELVVTALASAKYAGAGAVVFAVAMGLAIQSIGAITEVGILFSRRSYLKLYAYAIGVLAAALAMPALGGRFGIVGVAWGGLAAFAAKAIAEAWLAQRAHPLEWRYAGPLGVCAVTLGIGLAFQASFASAEIGGVHWLPLAAVPGVLAAGWLVLGSDDRQRVMGWLSRRSRA